MYKFSKRSKSRLSTCDNRLIIIFNEVIKEVDITILEGHRSPERQFELYKKGLSKCDGIEVMSNHNYNPSRAVDVAPYPIDWNDLDRFKEVSDIVKRIANEMDIPIRWGGDYKSFYDGPHYELL